jgi:hypothetical protein
MTPEHQKNGTAPKGDSMITPTLRGTIRARTTRPESQSSGSSELVDSVRSIARRRTSITRRATIITRPMIPSRACVPSHHECGERVGGSPLPLAS